MSFIHDYFLITFLIFLCVYFNVDYKYRKFLLLITSYLFYFSLAGKCIFILLFTTLIDYYVGLTLYQFQYSHNNDRSKQNKKNLLFLLSLFTNLLMLFIFKYYNFFVDNFSFLSAKEYLPYSNLILPAGISFYTFQSLGYIIDIYNEKAEAEKNFVTYALYISFFPQLLSGPIEKAQEMIPQLIRKTNFDFDFFMDGLLRFSFGLFKKLVIADRVAIVVNIVYKNPDNYSWAMLVVATFLYSIQIYCDFSGYCDMAIGISKMLGIKLTENFQIPYFSSSIKEFWKRWHITLGRWFRVYVYIPIGGNRNTDGSPSIFRGLFNIWVVFFLCGLWHGANWTFVVWGMLHAFYYSIETILGVVKEKIANSINANTNLGILRSIYNSKYFTLSSSTIYKFSSIFILQIKIAITFILVNIAWIFFRANNLSDAVFIFNKIFFSNHSSIEIKNELIIPLQNMFASSLDLPIIMIVLPISILITYILIKIKEIKSNFNSCAWVPLKSSIFYIIILSIMIFKVSKYAEFIYFQF
ncbi:MAG: MBOAT family protein [Oligoflexia bacterium]|nr:MBOAT family protein [Oligoflexia bacterium]